MKEHSLFPHPGCANHGCEAIVRSTKKILNSPIKLFSYNKRNDIEFGLNDVAEIVQTNELKRIAIRNLFFKVHSLVSKNRNVCYKYRYKKLLDSTNKIAMSIGGDNYCYGIPYDLMYLNRKLNSKGTKTVLWGCSVDPDVLKNKAVVDDLKRYSLITARESITYNSLIDAGIVENVKLYPDPAFQLDKRIKALPKNIDKDNTIGINVSPMIMKYETNQGATINNYKELIRYIINNTKLNIMLIPHVTGIDNDDREPLKKLYEKFQNLNRMALLSECDCMDLKGYISQCKLFIGARTHATIAAYSTCVPTLVVGYSVKAKGIAKDIFGTYDKYVLPVQTLLNSDDLINAFKWLLENEEPIREYLTKFMPSYCNRSLDAKKDLDQINVEK